MVEDVFGHDKANTIQEPGGNRVPGNNYSMREPPVRFELTTARLRIESSTPELRWRIQTMPWSGLEPLCLSAPPPQDGVSTNFTTRANPFGAVSLRHMTTGPTGLEPATSRVTVECSNQTELRPQQLLSFSQLLLTQRPQRPLKLQQQLKGTTARNDGTQN